MFGQFHAPFNLTRRMLDIVVHDFCLSCPNGRLVCLYARTMYIDDFFNTVTLIVGYLIFLKSFAYLAYCRFQCVFIIHNTNIRIALTLFQNLMPLQRSWGLTFF